MAHRVGADLRLRPPEAFPGDRTAPMKRAFELANDDPWLTGLLNRAPVLARSSRATALKQSRRTVKPSNRSRSNLRTARSNCKIDLASTRYQLGEFAAGSAEVSSRE